MNASQNAAVSEMMNKYVSDCVGKLASKFKFDADEALASLDLQRLTLDDKPKKASKKSPRKEKADKVDKADKPKRAPTGYLLYSAEVRPEVKTELTEALDEGEKLKPQLVVAEIAKRWKALDDDERAEWNAKAKAAASGSEASE